MNNYLPSCPAGMSVVGINEIEPKEPSATAVDILTGRIGTFAGAKRKYRMLGRIK